MKRAIALLLVLMFICSLAPMALADGTEPEIRADVQAANELYKLGLFKGTGTDENGAPIYDLDRAPTRHEAVTMLVRLLGKENLALTGKWSTPFTDVADWAAPYVGYAYTNKLTNGVSADAYGGEATVTASQYITFVLRALGYESGNDFQWDSAWTLSDEIGLTDGSYNGESEEFNRGDVAIVSRNALNMKLKDSDTTLFELLNKDGFGKMEGKLKPYDLKFVKIGGRLYENADLSVEQFGGGDYYVQAKDLFTLFVILTEKYTVNGSYASSSYLAGKIDKYSNATNESFG
ncbi:MAG: S-layer homology domain-containing protein, partial [Oscillospiraceae bacterium]|nr:S-layer homology domain-containing protein [Oscillospiraceae bacterium]